MEDNELIRRAEDLLERCGRTGSVTMTGFLTPAERVRVESWAKHRKADAVFSGGSESCERTVCFFLPDYMDKQDFEPGEYIRAMSLTAFFGEPGHRDYMGALLGMGVSRDRIGDIWVQGDKAYIFCLPAVLPHLLSIDKVGRFTVRTEELELLDVPAPERRTESISFSVQSPRLDAVLGGMFRLSRSAAAKYIASGLVSVNYSECLKSDMQVHEGDAISLRGVGKGVVGASGGISRKGRQFINAEIFK